MPEKIETFLDWLQKSLEKARFRENAKNYFENSTRQSALFAVGAWFFIALIIGKIAESLLFGIVAGIIFFAAKMYYPTMKKKQLAALVEKDLPFALLSMSVELNLNVPFEKAMEGIADGKYGMASNEFEAACEEIQSKGASVQESLLHLSERIDSLQVKRCVSQMVSIYEQGGRKNKGLPVKRLAKEILSKQRAESKEFSGKLVVFSLMFIAVSAIVPALFQSYIIVGSMFLETNITAPQVLLIVALGFPLLDLAILAYIKGKTPVFLKE